MNQITADQLRESVSKANIQAVAHHRCGACEAFTYYVIQEGHLFFDGTCECTQARSGLRPLSWDDAAEWINMQHDENTKKAILARFGIVADHNE